MLCIPYVYGMYSIVQKLYNKTEISKLVYKTFFWNKLLQYERSVKRLKSPLPPPKKGAGSWKPKGPKAYSQNRPRLPTYTVATFRSVWQ